MFILLLLLLLLFMPLLQRILVRRGVEDRFTTVNLWQMLRSTFRNGSVATKLIIVNVWVFVVIAVGKFVVFITGSSMEIYTNFLSKYFELPSSWESLRYVPWTPLTYMVIHYGFFHIVFNMLFLWWFSRQVKGRISSKGYLAVYIVGGLVGGALYLLTSHGMGDMTSHLSGASAAVMAIIFMSTTAGWREQVELPLFGRIRNYTIFAIFAFVVLLWIFVGERMVGMAHFGGALVGSLAGCYMFLRERNGGRTYYEDLHWDGESARESSRMDERESPQESSARKREDERRVNEILDKVAESGYDSLTIEEKNILFKSGQK